MKYTSAQANKLLKKLNDEYSALLDKEQRSRDFRAAMGEDIESVRPAYDYAKTQARLEELEGTIRRLKHAINRFNTTQVVDGFGITTDGVTEGFYRAHQRPEDYRELHPADGAYYDKYIEIDLSKVEPMIALPFHPSNAWTIHEFLENAADILAAVEADYEKTADELSRAQLALDTVNQRDSFEFCE